MTQSYKTPTAFRTAFETRLKDEAKRSGRNFERLRQIQLYERFLARIFPCFEGSVILKGGLALEFRLERARSTKDIDLHVWGNPDDVLVKLREAGQQNLGDYFSFDITLDGDNPDIVADGLKYGGKRYRVIPRLAGTPYGWPFGVDIALADTLIGRPEWIDGSAFFSFVGLEPLRCRVYPLATHLAEKLDAYTQPRPTENSRVKDLPDIALLATAGPLEGPALYSAIEQVFHHRKRESIPTFIPDPPDSWGPRYAVMAKAEHLSWPTLDILLTAVRAFLHPVLNSHMGRWDPLRWEWR